MSEYRIPMIGVNEIEASYGIVSKSAVVYRTDASSAPTRVVLWENRLAPEGEEESGAFIDPHNKPTDEPFTVLLTPEATIISTQPSDKVWSAMGEIIRTDDVLTLIDLTKDAMPTSKVTVRMTNNGHGEARFI